MEDHTRTKSAKTVGYAADAATGNAPEHTAGSTVGATCGNAPEHTAESTTVADSEKIKELNLWAARIRKTALQTIQNAGSGHIGGSFSIADILSILYFDQMNIDPARPHMTKRDRLVLSKGHCSPALYATLALRGFYPREHLMTFRTIDSDLSGHAEMHVPGVDMSTGSLAQGLSAALGMAMYNKTKHLSDTMFCILGDGEIQEGQIWEAAPETGAIVTAEEHNVIGGLGSAVAEVIVRSDIRTPVEMVGVEDVFGHSAAPDILLDRYGLSASHIVEKAKKVIERKQAC